VPEAPINEHGDLLAWKDQVRPPTHIKDRPLIQSESKASPVQLASDRSLAPRVPLAL
jgi:hypothetical protein